MRTNYPEDFKSPAPASVDYEQLLHNRAESDAWAAEQEQDWRAEFDAKFLEPDPQSGLPCYTQHPDTLKDWVDDLIRQVEGQIPNAAFCPQCGATQMLVDEEMRKDDLNEHPWRDLTCSVCHLVINSVSRIPV